jgi:phosphocarrier protein HPr
MANGKSLLGLISLGVPQGAVVTITATGDDAKEAVTTIEAMLQTLSSASASECLASA